MSASTLVIGDTLPFTHFTKRFPQSDRWELVATITDSANTSIVSETSLTTYNVATGLWEGLFLSDMTTTLVPGVASFTLQFKRDFTPALSVQDIRTDVTGKVVNVVAPNDVNTSSTYYITQLTKVRACIAARLSGGVAEYSIADYSMRYLSLEELMKLERYYESKIASENSGSNRPTVVIFGNHA